MNATIENAWTIAPRHDRATNRTKQSRPRARNTPTTTIRRAPRGLMNRIEAELDPRVLTPAGRAIVLAYVAGRRDTEIERQRLATALCMRCLYALGYTLATVAQHCELDRAELDAEERRFSAWITDAAEREIIDPTQLTEPRR